MAGVDHPGIVPVHDLGRTDDGLCYVVSKYVAGDNLAKLIAHDRPPLEESVAMIASVALALHHAHQRPFPRPSRPTAFGGRAGEAMRECARLAER